jgi:hypothetical protein
MVMTQELECDDVDKINLSNSGTTRRRKEAIRLAKIIVKAQHARDTRALIKGIADAIEYSAPPTME